jgi:sensor domain CHASE-containing protein
MKSVLLGLGISIVIAVAAWFYLETNLQQTAQSAFSTTGVRL